MKILFLGDSITEGSGATTFDDIYINHIAKKLNCESINYGIGGTRFAKQKNKSENPLFDSDFIQRIDKMDNEADYVIVFGGTNDYGSGDAQLGDINSDDPYTFFGATNIIISRLIAKYGKNKIGVILPLHRFNDEKPNPITKASLSVYVAIINYVCQKNGIKVLDLFNNFFPKPKTNLGDALTVDGLHPNDNGHKYIAGLIADFIKTNIGN